MGPLEFRAGCCERSIRGDLRLINNFGLTSLVGLAGLSSVGGDVELDRNIALTSLAGLENLSSVAKSLTIGSNPSLMSLADLTSLSTVGKDVDITDNDNLCEDEVGTLTAQLTSFSGTVTNNNNLGTCPSA